MPVRGPLAQQQVQLFVTVEMVLVGLVADLHALQQLARDVGIASGGDERGEPVETGENAVLDRAGFDLARLADDARHAEGALGGHARGTPRLARPGGSGAVVRQLPPS